MAKIKYYYKDEDGNEVLARTSNREYHYYCYGTCSKKVDNIDRELKTVIRHEERWLDELVNWENRKHSQFVIEHWGDEETRKQKIEKVKDCLNRLHQVKIYELYTK